LPEFFVGVASPASTIFLDVRFFVLGVPPLLRGFMHIRCAALKVVIHIEPPKAARPADTDIRHVTRPSYYGSAVVIRRVLLRFIKVELESVGFI
jgi:hypothetical protein